MNGLCVAGCVGHASVHGIAAPVLGGPSVRCVEQQPSRRFRPTLAPTKATGEGIESMDDEDGLDWSAIDQIVASQSQEPQVNTPPPPVQTANDDAEDDEAADDESPAMSAANT